MQVINYLKEAVIFSQFNLAKLKAKRSEILDSIYKEGFSLQTGLIQNEDLNQLKETLDNMYNDSTLNIWQDDKGADKRIYGLNQINPNIERLLPISMAKEIGEEYLGRKLVDYFVLGGHISYQPENYGSGGGWHRDSPFTHQFKMIIYLSDVDKENGPFQYFKGSHLSSSKMKLNFPLSQMRFTENEVNTLDQQELVEFNGKAGDVLFVDTRGIHRGKPLVSGERKAITVYFFENSNAKSRFDKYLQKS